MTKKKLTLTDLIQNKEKFQVKNKETEELYIERFDATVTIEKPERSLVLEALSMAEDKEQSTKADAFLVYNIMVEPNLKDKELQKEFGCVEPTDIVEKIFEPGEVTNIAKIALEMVGYDNAVKRVRDLKN